MGTARPYICSSTLSIGEDVRSERLFAPVYFWRGFELRLVDDCVGGGDGDTLSLIELEWRWELRDSLVLYVRRFETYCLILSAAVSTG